MESSALENAEYWLSWIAAGKLIAAFLVAVGVAVEFGSEWISRPFEETVRHAREMQLSTLERETAEARVKQREAEERTEQLRASVQRNVEPRRITAPDKFIKVMGETSPATAEVLYDPSALDGSLLAISIAASLKQAGWSVTPGLGLGIAPFDPAKPEPVAGSDLQLPPILSGKVSPWGITILANKLPRENDQSDPAKSLAKAISDAGGEIYFSLGLDETLPDNVFKIVVEHKALSFVGAPTDAKANDTEQK